MTFFLLVEGKKGGRHDLGFSTLIHQNTLTENLSNSNSNSNSNLILKLSRLLTSFIIFSYLKKLYIYSLIFLINCIYTITSINLFKSKALEHSIGTLDLALEDLNFDFFKLEWNLVASNLELLDNNFS